MSPKTRAIRVGEWLYRTAYDHRRVVAISLYGGIVAVAYLLAYLLRFDLAFPREYAGTFWKSLLILLVLRGVSSMLFGMTTGRWRFISTRDVRLLVVNTATASAVFFLLTWFVLPFEPIVPRSVVLLEWLLTTFLTAALWLSYRTAFEAWRHYLSGFNGSARRVVIVGAGEAGNLLAREMSRLPTGMRLVGFVDDDRTRKGIRLHGLPVLGAVEQLSDVVRSEEVEEIIIAVPSALPNELRRIVEYCEQTGKPLGVARHRRSAGRQRAAGAAARG